MVAYYPVDGCSVQGVGGCEPPEIAGCVVQGQRPDVDGIVRAPGHDAAGGDEAPGSARSGEPGGRRLARAREAALSESGSVARDLRTLDRQIRTSSPRGAE